MITDSVMDVGGISITCFVKKPIHWILNMLACFSKTYEEIESSSTYYWNYQRYQMINDYVHRSPLVPPIIIIWHFYEAYRTILDRCASFRSHENTKNNPFCEWFEKRPAHFRVCLCACGQVNTGEIDCAVNYAYGEDRVASTIYRAVVN